jgi:hypothetical protein
MFAHIATTLVFIATAAGIWWLATFPDALFPPPAAREQRQARVLVPQVAPTTPTGTKQNTDDSFQSYLDRLEAKLPLNDGELLVTVLTDNFDSDPAEEQIIAYRHLATAHTRAESDNPIYLAYIDFNEASHTYTRLWDVQTGARRPDISLYTQDIIGDRSPCIIVDGISGTGEHTLTILRNSGAGQFKIIADLCIDGTITIEKKERTEAYQMGVTNGQSFPIIARGHDSESENLLDQIEITYAYNALIDRYEQTKISRISGTQIEQRRLQELFRGGAAAFEQFIDGLWYYVSPQGSTGTLQFIYFDPKNREIIFYDNDIQQVFNWQNSGATRYGVHINSNNISVTTLRRSLDVEFESLDSLRIKVFEDVRLKIGINASWDGSYRRIKTTLARTTASPAPLYRDVRYTSIMGTMQFLPDGSYTLESTTAAVTGSYSFFLLNGQEVLELRPASTSYAGRETYTVETSANDNLVLTRIRLGAQGIQRIPATVLILNPAE